MMKLTRSIALHLALAVLAPFAALGGLLAPAVQRSLEYVSRTTHKMADGIAQFDREMAFKFAEKVDRVAKANSDLARESNGFRQASAYEAQADKFTAQPS